MFYDNKIWIASSEGTKLNIIPKMANRHGIIAGATGTGKTITLKVLAESFSDCGTAVFLSDVKGDLAGMCNPGVDSENMQERIKNFGLSEAGFKYQAYPSTYWDIYGKKGLPLRTTVSEMGPTMLGRLLELSDTQTDVLTMVFKIADDEKLLLIDTKDLRAMLLHVGENAKEYSASYGNMTKATLDVLTRKIIALEEEGGDVFFGEPALDIMDWFKTDSDGRGMINILDSSSLINSPMMYSTFMLWMMSELFELLPEAGDLDKPKMVFFFDEAHLLFNDAPKALIEKIEQVVKLIRSKGVGIYFITQSPSDIPDGVLGQLGNKIQHALHAYTPADQKAVKAAADSFRVNEKFDTKEVLQELGVGEALVSFLQEDGSPAVVERAKILPPQSQMGPIDDTARAAQINGSALYSKYGTMVDRDSAYEFLQRKSADEAKAQAAAQEEAQAAQAAAAQNAEAEKEKSETVKRASKAAKSTAKTAAGTVGRQLGNELGKALGGSFGKKMGGNIGASLARGILGTFLK